MVPELLITESSLKLLRTPKQLLFKWLYPSIYINVYLSDHIFNLIFTILEIKTQDVFNVYLLIHFKWLVINPLQININSMLWKINILKIITIFFQMGILQISLLL